MRTLTRISAMLAMLGAFYILAPKELGSETAVAEPASVEGFCDGRQVRDYERPFRQMPPVRRPPRSGQLPFAPPQTVFEATSGNVLVPDTGAGREFGYDFSATPGENRTFTLNWVVTFRLVRVDRTGSTTELLADRRLRIGRVEEVQFNRLSARFVLPSRPAFYRVETTFRSVGGELLARYGEYLRVVKPTFQVRLGLTPTAVRSGEVLHFKVENLGTRTIQFREADVIQRRGAGGEWLTVSPIGPTHPVVVSVAAGQTSKCERFEVPPDMGIGQYRLGKRVLGRAGLVAANFEVIG